MGIIQMGIPKKQVSFIKKSLGLDTFIEGGTFYGNTARYASNFFKKVITIEKSKVIFKKASESLSGIKNLQILKGDTRKFLNELTLENDNILFWLDSHWSGGETYGKEDECPLLEELEIIFKHDKNFVILIDDARLFLSPPPLPHKIENWPTIEKIIKAVPSKFKILIYEDVIYIVPREFKALFWNFIQKDVTEKWRSNSKKGMLIKKLKRLKKFKFFKPLLYLFNTLKNIK
jgi:hypothetical protein